MKQHIDLGHPWPGNLLKARVVKGKQWWWSSDGINAINDWKLHFSKVCLLKCLDLVHWEDPEGSGGEGGGMGDRDGEYMYIHGWFMSVYDKNHYNIVK